jgi:tol-pal system protein YbgF
MTAPTPDVERMPPVPPPTVATGAEQADFDAALGALRDGHYPQAIADFQGFLNAYPDSRLAGDAQYGLGESYYVSRNYEAAKEAFINLGLRYPQSARLPDALLKLGYIYGELGDTARARDVLQKLVQVYPDSQAAGLAEQQLQSLR